MSHKKTPPGKLTEVRITETFLGLEEHISSMVFKIHFSGNGVAGTINSLTLDHLTKKGWKSWGRATRLIRALLETVGVKRWEALTGAYIKIYAPGPGRCFPPIIGSNDGKRWINFNDYKEAK